MPKITDVAGTGHDLGDGVDGASPFNARHERRRLELVLVLPETVLGKLTAAA